MPPRSRKRGAKSSSKSKRQAVESTTAANENAVPDATYDVPASLKENEDPDSSPKVFEASAEMLVEAVAASSPPDNGIKKEVGDSVESFMEYESVVEVKVKEEIVQEEENNEDDFVENCMNWSNESDVMDKNLDTNMEENANLNSEGIVEEGHLNSNVNGEVVEEEKDLGTNLEDNSNLNSEGVEGEKNLEATLEENSKLNSEGVVERGGDTVVEEREESVEGEKKLDAIVEENSKLNTEGVVERGGGIVVEEREEVENAIGSDGSKLHRNGAVVGAVEEETSGTNYKDVNSLGHVDDLSDIKEGGDGAGEDEKSTNDGEDDDDSEGNEEDNLEDEDLFNIKEGGDELGEDEKSSDDGEDDDDNEGNEGDNVEDEDLYDIKEGSDGVGEDEKRSDDGEDDDDSEGSEEDNIEDEDPSEFISDSLTDTKKQKQLEIYIGGLDRAVVEEELIEVFGKFGEVQAARIAKHPTTNKSKGFAFIRYATVEQAKHALSELKDEIEVRGKRVKIEASQGNDTLYMGNICKTWTKEHVLEKLRVYGIEHIEEINLPYDPVNEGKIKGFALLEFSTHSDAMAAFQRLRKPDVVFGIARSAKVAFAQTPMHPSEEVLSQVKTVFVEGLTKSWDVEKLKEICKQYGEIEKVKLSRNFGTKRKNFGFIFFTSRESALACVEGINNAQIEGVKVKANMAKPNVRGRHKRGTCGGFKVTEKMGRAAEMKMKGHAKLKEAEKGIERKGSAGSYKSKITKEKGKAVSEEMSQIPTKLKRTRESRRNKPQSRVAEGHDVGMPSKPEKTNRKRNNLPPKVYGHRKRERDHDYSKKSSKKPRGNAARRQGNTSRNSRSRPHFREGPVHSAYSVAYGIPYASGYAASISSYQGHAHGSISGFKSRHSDMEPHAGYLEPAVRKQDRRHAGYLEPALGHQAQPHARYLEPAFGNQGPPHARYLEPALGNQGQPHARYLEPALAREGLPHAGYLEPAVGKRGFDAYDYRLRRTGAYDGLGSQGSAYGGGSALPPSYVANYTGYAAYEVHGSVSHRSSEAYLPR